MVEDDEEAFLSKDAYIINKKYIEAWRQKKIRRNYRKKYEEASESTNDKKDLSPRSKPRKIYLL